jgi:DNA-directed RNA polymerase subunit RPC12/RpoP
MGESLSRVKSAEGQCRSERAVPGVNMSADKLVKNPYYEDVVRWPVFWEVEQAITWGLIECFNCEHRSMEHNGEELYLHRLVFRCVTCGESFSGDQLAWVSNDT